jgi:hypothetical protein
LKRVVQLLTLLLVLSLPSTVMAGNSLWVGGQKPYTNGTYQTVQGAQAVITLPSSFPTVSSGQMSTAYVAVTNAPAIAQAGLAFEPSVSNVNPHYFLGHRPVGGIYAEIRLQSGPSTSSAVTYVIKKESGSWKGYYNGNLIGSTTDTVTPVKVEYFNETYDDGQRWLGTSSSNPLKFSSVQYWDGSASGSDTSKWVWRKPSLSSSDFLFNGDSGITYSNYSSSGYWTSWYSGGV